MIPLTVPEIARLLSETATMHPVTRPDLAGTTSHPARPRRRELPPDTIS
jgi:hypothetical protein